MERVLVTGTTGLVGCAVIKQLLKENYEIVGLVRDIEKARKMYGNMQNIHFVIGDVSEFHDIDMDVDYIIHGASQTASKAFVEMPVETIKTAVLGTINLLELARKKNVKSFVYLSSMEVYGAPTNDEKIDELYPCNLDVMSTRSSYPESKRMCESLCRSYWVEYGVPAKVIRLTQTFGEGVSYTDGRVFAEFARCYIEKRNIVLHTKGTTKRSYLSTPDAANAIITVLLKGENGEAYNAANEDTYCTIYEMAKLVAKDKIDVIIEEDSVNRGYAPVLHMNLDTSKLKDLGWYPRKNLENMFDELIESMKKERD